jgi:periplasmic divalent cation tolerance protein
MVFIYITNPNKKTAVKVAGHLLNEKLVACCNIFPIESLYWWEGRIENAKEYVLIAKTLAKNYSAIKKEVEKIHPYKIPCILKISSTANPKYQKWLEKEIN